MTKLCLLLGLFCGLAGFVYGEGLDDALDRAGDALRLSSDDGQYAARLSGTLDLEAYALQQPAQGLLYTERRTLLNPRLSLFLDATAGERAYVFVQVRGDRGFDPSSDGLRVRADEYAARFAIVPDRSWSVQVGKFATVVGNWVKHHRSWEDPFITAPVPYNTLTPMWDGVPAESLDVLRHWAHFPPSRPTYEDMERQIPIVWGPSYATGVALLGRFERWSVDLEMKNASLSSRPETWDPSDALWKNPTVSGRIGYSPNVMWSMGLSFSDGVYLKPDAIALAREARSLSSYRQYVVGYDLAFAHHHLQVSAEAYATRFEVPGAGDLDALSYYLEASYRVAPQLTLALRWGELRYGHATDGAGESLSWGHDTSRIDFAPTWRLSAHLQLKLQYSLQHEEQSTQTWNHLGAAQLTLRF
ncbi:hypothetical protein DB347_22435 [Opitutaceae bacterium EW11]|nr:hypothetical protein DB347_22435 [Opitutaceae bacterium EW11]